MTIPANFVGRHGKGSRQAGFTLVELLVSLMILAIILSFIPGTLRIGQRVWETDEIFERRAALSAFRRYVEQRLAEAMPINLRDRVQGVRIVFSGAPDRVAFVAPAAAGPAGGGVYRFELRRGDGTGAGQPLILSQSLFRFEQASVAADGSGSAASSMEHRSAALVAGLSLRYFGPPKPQAPPQWQSQWPRSDSLPELVEISLTSSGPRPKIERSVVPLRLGFTQ
jgi:prepilin-type N-terminal cleavage/methylation domain-containing protein